jgi:hypothetical protein
MKNAPKILFWKSEGYTLYEGGTRTLENNIEMDLTE